MKLLLSKFLSFLPKNKEKKKTNGFVDFFLHASEEEKKRVFEDAAKRANNDQRTLVENINKLQQKAT